MPVKLHRDVTAHDQGQGRRGRRKVVSRRRSSDQSATSRRVFCSGRFSFRLTFYPSPSRPMPDVAVAERTLPHNLEAERSVLGAILLHNDAFNLAAEVIDSQRFLPRRAPAHLRQDGQARRARRRDRSRHAQGGARAVGRARRGRRPGLHHGARRRRAALDQRRALRADHQGEGDAPEPDLLGQQDSRDARTTAEEDADVILDQAEHAIFAIADDKVRDGFVSLRDLAQGSLDTIEKLHARKELVTGVPTGFTDLDEMTSGLQPSDLVIVAARPSMGKTSLVLNIAQHVGTKTDMTVGIFSLEMSKEQLFLRMLTGRGAHRRAPAARRVSRRARLGPAVAGDRHAQRGEDLHRRHAVDRRARDARQVPAARGRARPAPGHHRLHPADAGPRPVREPHARARRRSRGR